MKQYVIDELRPADIKKIKSYLNDNFPSAGMSGIYWIPLDQAILTDIQAGHEKCQPFFFVIDLEQNMMICELLVRIKSRISCDCIGYATEHQRNWFISYIDIIFEKLGINA